jgi:cytochrome c peroxidase
MFGGENGGTGIFTDDEQEALVAFAERLPVPLNPHLVGADLSPDAKLGRDLFFGINDTSLNPGLRNSNCQSCHAIQLPSGSPAWFTNDQLKIFDSNFDQAHQDPCLVLRESVMGEAVSNVNSGVNIRDEQTNQLIVDRNADGISDLESYTPMNEDGSGDFTRDDPNSVDCLESGGGQTVFNRAATNFNVPTKMGAFFTGPYFHDHAVRSLREVLDPQAQTFPSLNKLRNTQHDVRGTNVQSFLSSTDASADIELLLRFIQSL